MRKRLIRFVALASVVVATASFASTTAASAAVATAPAQSAQDFTPQSFPARTSAALDWLARELRANGWQMPSSFSPTSADWGLTADAVLALAAGGRAQSFAARRTTDNLLAHGRSYVTDIDFGPGNDRYAGPIGKLLLTTLVERRNPFDVDGLNLVKESRARMQTTGAQSGRFSLKHMQSLWLAAVPDQVERSARQHHRRRQRHAGA